MNQFKNEKIRDHPRSRSDPWHPRSKFLKSGQGYPNPTAGNLTIDLGSEVESAQVMVADLAGNLIHTEAFHHTRLLSMVLDAPAGVYLMTIRADGKKMVVRVVKGD